MTRPPVAQEVERLTSRRRSCGRWSAARPEFLEGAAQTLPSLRRYIQVLIRDIHLIKKSLSGEFRNRGGDFGMTLILATKGRQRRVRLAI